MESRGGRGRSRYRGRHGNSERGRGASAELSSEEANSPVVGMFRVFACQLDSKHDRHERLVKKSRDVTIESKRIIFMLHRVTEDGDSQQLLQQAAARFQQLEATTLREIASELRGQDPYLFMRAISPGLQEYIEALSFYHFLLREDLISWQEAQARLTFPADGGAKDTPSGAPAATPAGPTPPETADEVASPVKTETEAVVLLLPYHEYVLGLADLTGELMRRCISCVGAGRLHHCWRLCAVLRSVLEGFINIGNTGPRELTRKLQTLRQSVAKVENACYQLKVRGEELPQHMLADVLAGDDGYPPPDEYAAD